MIQITNNINDANEDFDQDGLSNLEEYRFGTNPFSKDTDDDGLSDYQEVEVYGTNPNKADTDGDGLNDYDETILGFNPNKADTNDNGIIDSKEKTEQSVDMKYWSTDGENNIFTPSLIIHGAGDANNCTVVSDIYNDNVLKNIRAMVGHPIEIKTESDFDWAEIGFKLNDPNILGSRVDKGNQDPYNIKSLNDLTIAWYKEDTNQLIPIKTTVDKENYTLKARVNHFSKYLVINKNILNYDWDVSNTSSKIDSGKADVVFAIDSTGSMKNSIDNVKTYISRFADNLQDKNVDVRLGLIDYQDITCDGPNSTRNWGWFVNPTDFKDTLSKIYADDGGDIPESSVDALEESRRMGFRDTANKFIVLVTDTYFKEETRFPEIKSMSDEITKLKQDGIITSVITSDPAPYKALYEGTNGIYAYIYNDFTDSLNQLIDNIKNNVTNGVWIRLSNGTIVKLKKEPDKNDKITDTDGDGVPDSGELLDKVNVEVDPDSGKTIETWTFKSNPTIKDTDGDGLDDKAELLNGTNPCNIDTDNDALTDYEEVNGMALSTGEVIKTNPNNADTDGDGLLDGDEIWQDYDNPQIYCMDSNPNMKDSDNDGFNDDEDYEPLVPDKDFTDEELDDINKDFDSTWDAVENDSIVGYNNSNIENSIYNSENANGVKISSILYSSKYNSTTAVKSLSFNIPNPKAYINKLKNAIFKLAKKKLKLQFTNNHQVNSFTCGVIDSFIDNLNIKVVGIKSFIFLTTLKYYEGKPSNKYYYWRGKCITDAAFIASFIDVAKISATMAKKLLQSAIVEGEITLAISPAGPEAAEAGAGVEISDLALAGVAGLISGSAAVAAVNSISILGKDTKQLLKCEEGNKKVLTPQQLNKYKSAVESGEDVWFQTKEQAVNFIRKKFPNFKQEVAGSRSAEGWHFDSHPINGSESSIDHINIYSKKGGFRVHITWGSVSK